MLGLGRGLTPHTDHTQQTHQYDSQLLFDCTAVVCLTLFIYHTSELIFTLGCDSK